jgi:hypothetical protein
VKIYLSLLSFFLFVGGVRANEQPAVPCKPQPFIIHLSKRENFPFYVGENFIYEIKYEFVPAGKSSLEVHEGPIINCQRTFELRSTAQSSKFIDKFFKVRDNNSSIVSQESLATFSFHQNLREGSYRVIRHTTIDYTSGTFKYEREYKGKKNERGGTIDRQICDILSAFFYARTLPLELGQEYFIDVFSDPDIYPLRVKVFPKLEDVNVKAGRFECIKIQPFVQGDAIFKARGGQMIIWLTSDERKIPVLIRSKVSIGAFDAELTQFDMPKRDMVNE